MFRGITNLSLDDKGRMLMPARYRDRLQEISGGQLIMTVDSDGCLLLYPFLEWEKIEKELAALPSLNQQARRLQRLLIGHATECRCDRHGRILIPPPLREFGALERQVVLVGQGRRFELWDESAWRKQRDLWMEEELQDDQVLPESLRSLAF